MAVHDQLQHDALNAALPLPTMLLTVQPLHSEPTAQPISPPAAGAAIPKRTMTAPATGIKDAQDADVLVR
jgi:hypothetical protein